MKSFIRSVLLATVLASGSYVFAAERTLDLDIPMSSTSRQLGFFEAKSTTNYTMSADVTVATKTGFKTYPGIYIQMINLGELSPTNVIDNCLANAKKAKVHLQITLDTRGVQLDPKNTSVINLTYKPTLIGCYELPE